MSSKFTSELYVMAMKNDRKFEKEFDTRESQKFAL